MQMKQMPLLRTLLLFCAIFTVGSTPALAVEPDEILSDPVLEARAREVSLNLRCLVCQNQSIDDSNAELAKDLRVLVRERLTKGDTNEQATDYIVDRYGEYVLLKPRMGLHTLILWFGPLALLLFAAGYFYMNRPVAVGTGGGTSSGGAGVKALSKEERERLAKLMDSD